ncbi:WYL domain-containing protein [Hyunsoonleella aestuarii]|uniref:WYL domain-containing protein n=1 Tax=Hyunsoonleella aestuarii TaxID=912802 RepID=A0ABP8EEF8_9FLAO
MLEECNKALRDLDPDAEGIKKRQLYDDIRFMQSEQGWSVELKKEKSGRQVFYSYEDSNFSIKNQSINEMEANYLKSAISVLNRFKGLPQFKWIEELIPKINQSFGLSNNEEQVLGFDSNEYLKGIEFLSELFNALIYNTVLNIKYQSFNNPNPLNIILHPYYLRQYNNRWFLFGKNPNYENITNLALDRIIDIVHVNMPFIPNLEVDFDDYFSDIVGVTVPLNEETLKIELLAKQEIAPYIQTKPLHESQTPLRECGEGYKFSIKVIPNKELESLILSYGKGLKVTGPENFKLRIKQSLLDSLDNYD